MRPLLGFATCVLVGLALFPSSIRAADQQHVARPGTLNYVEGQVTLGSKSLDALSIGTVGLDPGQTLTTQNGKAELLLTHGVFVRLGPSSAATMIASGLTSTRLSVDEGEAFVEVTEIHPENDLRILEDGVSTELVKMGLYNFNANLHVVRVLDGEAIVDDGEKSVTVKAITWSIFRPCLSKSKNSTKKKPKWRTFIIGPACALHTSLKPTPITPPLIL